MKWPRWLGSRIKILKNTLHSKLSEKTGLPKRKVYLTGFHLWDYAMLLSKPATISCRFGCAACAWYTFIKLGIMMCIFSFVYFLSQCLFFLACCSNWMILRSIGKKNWTKSRDGLEPPRWQYHWKQNTMKKLVRQREETCCHIIFGTNHLLLVWTLSEEIIIMTTEIVAEDLRRYKFEW